DRIKVVKCNRSNLLIVLCKGSQEFLIRVELRCHQISAVFKLFLFYVLSFFFSHRQSRGKKAKQKSNYRKHNGSEKLNCWIVEPIWLYLPSAAGSKAST